MRQKLEHREQRIAFEELSEAVRQESEGVARLEQAIREAVPEWSFAEPNSSRRYRRCEAAVTCSGAVDSTTARGIPEYDYVAGHLIDSRS